MDMFTTLSETYDTPWKGHIHCRIEVIIEVRVDVVQEEIDWTSAPEYVS